MGKVPWLTYASITFLEAILRPTWHVFEWGMGASTTWLAERVKYVVSVEHDRQWFQKVAKPPNAECLLIPPEHEVIGSDVSEPSDYCTKSYPGCNFKSYASAIDGRGPFDLVLVDGRARPSCLWHGHRQVKPGHYLVLDNSDREYYVRHTVQFLEGWERYSFWGSGPHVNYWWQTTIWRHPA